MATIQHWTNDYDKSWLKIYCGFCFGIDSLLCVWICIYITNCGSLCCWTNFPALQRSVIERRNNYSHDQIVVSLIMVVGLRDLRLYTCNWRDYSLLKKFPMYLTTEWLLLLHPFRPISVSCCTFLFFFFQICNQVNPYNFISSGACLE